MRTTSLFNKMIKKRLGVLRNSNFSNEQVIYTSFSLRKTLFHFRAYESITLGKYYERISEIFPAREMQRSMLHFHCSREFNAQFEFIIESSSISLICVTMIYANEVINRSLDFAKNKK
jgi:hypothetical protein